MALEGPALVPQGRTARGSCFCGRRQSVNPHAGQALACRPAVPPMHHAHMACAHSSGSRSGTRLHRCGSTCQRQGVFNLQRRADYVDPLVALGVCDMMTALTMRMMTMTGLVLPPPPPRPKVHIALVEGQHRDTPLACTVGLTKWERPDPRTPACPDRLNRETW